MRLLDELQLFDRLARLRHYGRAAAESHVSPSTLSRAIARLEGDVGLRLFDRDRRGVALTEDGARFHAFARDVLRTWSAFVAASGPDAVTGSLSIFCTVTASQSVLPDVLSRFRTRHPGIQLSLETGYAAEALERLERGAVDVTVAPMPSRVPRHLLTRPIAETSLVLVAPTARGYDIDATQSPSWSSMPFVLP
jgi:LysR family positive regulator for ilvC